VPHSFGYRARTRDKFSKAFKKHGMPSLSRYLINFKRGDYVDVVVDAAVQKGMPYSYYHGRTGVVFDVTQRALGVEIKKVVGNRQIVKRIHVRVEHVRKSRCQEDFLQRKIKNDKLREEANKAGKKICLKRVPVGPKPAYAIAPQEAHVLEPLTYVESY